jgi:hypothetical protein
MGSWRIIVRKNIQRRGTIVNSKQDQITPFQTIQTHRIENLLQGSVKKGGADNDALRHQNPPPFLPVAS